MQCKQQKTEWQCNKKLQHKENKNYIKKHISQWKTSNHNFEISFYQEPEASIKAKLGHFYSENSTILNYIKTRNVFYNLSLSIL